MEDRAASFPCKVQVFPLLVKTQLKKWPESRQRKVRWFPAPDAAAVIDDNALRKLVLQLKEYKRVVSRKNNKHGSFKLGPVMRGSMASETTAAILAVTRC